MKRQQGKPEKNIARPKVFTKVKGCGVPSPAYFPKVTFRRIMEMVFGVILRKEAMALSGK